MSAISTPARPEVLNCERCGMLLLSQYLDTRICGLECSSYTPCVDDPVATRCICCGHELVRRLAFEAFDPALPPSSIPILDDLAAAIWVQSYDAAWLGQDWERLQQRLAPDVKFMTKRFRSALVGRVAVMADIRAVMSRVQMHEYNATDLRGHSRGQVGVITYRWQLDCTIEDERTNTTGRDALILRADCDDWQLVWRAQLHS